jgi:diacylglycerol kinase (ATP)
LVPAEYAQRSVNDRSVSCEIQFGSHLEQRWNLVFNPKAGSAENETELRRFVRSLPQCEIPPVESFDPVAMAKHAVSTGTDGLIIAGGDGTIHAVINALGNQLCEIDVAIIPMGTGNDLARSLGIPLQLAGAIELFRSGARRRIDVARMACADYSRLMINASAAGFSDAVGAHADAETKSNWGSFAYIISAAAALPDLTRYHVAFEIDGSRFELDTFNVVVANGRFIAGGIPIAPEAYLDDGELDVIVLPAHSLTNAALAIPSILSGRHHESDRVLTTRAKRIRIESDPPMRFNADGESACEGWAEYELLPKFLRVIARANIDGLPFRPTDAGE